jgi:hypothetical protein
VPLGSTTDIEYELALGEPDDGLETAGEQALLALEARFSGVREAAREIVEPPSLSRRAGAALRGVDRSPRLRQSARRAKHGRGAPARRSSSRLYAGAQAHPVAAVATVAISIIVVVHFLAYITVELVCLAALKEYGMRRR